VILLTVGKLPGSGPLHGVFLSVRHFTHVCAHRITCARVCMLRADKLQLPEANCAINLYVAFPACKNSECIFS